MQKLPEGAFAYYVSLGPGRSYQAVADRFGMHKRTVVRTAEREEWAPRLAVIEKKAREGMDEKLAGEMQERQLRKRKLVLAIASRAAKAITDYPLTNGMQGIKAAELAIKLDQMLDGKSTDNAGADIEGIIRREYQELMTVEDDESEEPKSQDVESEGDSEPKEED